MKKITRATSKLALLTVIFCLLGWNTPALAGQAQVTIDLALGETISFSSQGDEGQAGCTVKDDRGASVGAGWTRTGGRVVLSAEMINPQWLSKPGVAFSASKTTSNSAVTVIFRAMCTGGQLFMRTLNLTLTGTSGGGGGGGGGGGSVDQLPCVGVVQNLSVDTASNPGQTAIIRWDPIKDAYVYTVIITTYKQDGTFDSRLQSNAPFSFLDKVISYSLAVIPGYRYSVKIVPETLKTKNYLFDSNCSAAAIDFNVPSKIYGIVKDKSTQQPLANATVTFSDGSVQTDANGNYNKGYYATNQTLTASITGYKSLTQTVTLPGNPRCDFELEKETFYIDGHILDSQGQDTLPKEIKQGVTVTVQQVKDEAGGAR
jgi:hypothetical protein